MVGSGGGEGGSGGERGGRRPEGKCSGVVISGAFRVWEGSGATCLDSSSPWVDRRRRAVAVNLRKARPQHAGLATALGRARERDDRGSNKTR